MKVAAMFTVFNGLELLRKSMANILYNVDEIIVCYQEISNKGQISKEITPFMMNLEQEFDCNIIRFHPDLTINTKQNEINKHNLMLDFARKLNCTHFILLATDHFYDADEFIHARNEVAASNLDVSLTAMYTYYKHPEWQIDPIEDYYMPFICKIYPDTRFERVPQFPVRTDPSVQVNTFKRWKLFHSNKIMLHHYSMIREDIRNKFDNAAASIRWTDADKKRFIEEYENYNLDENKGISYFGGRKIKQVKNFFNI